MIYLSVYRNGIVAYFEENLNFEIQKHTAPI